MINNTILPQEETILDLEAIESDKEQELDLLFYYNSLAANEQYN